MRIRAKHYFRRLMEVERDSRNILEYSRRFLRTNKKLKRRNWRMNPGD
jgi:hypothetical protein